MMKTLRISVCILSVIIVILSPVATISAQDFSASSSNPNRSIAFYPESSGVGTYITMELAPGESAKSNIVLGNSGDVEQTLRTYAVPAESGVNGGFVLAEQGAELDDVTSWLDYPEQLHTFEPGEGITIKVTVKVPTNTPPGEYVTGLAAEQADSFAVPGTELIRQRVRWSIPVLVIVPGERKPDFEITETTLDVREGMYVAEIGIANTGNVIVRPSGEVRILDSEGTVVGVARASLDSIYVGTDTTFIVAWDSIPTSSGYTLQIFMTNTEGDLEVEKQVDDLTAVDRGAGTKLDTDPLSFSKPTLTSTDNNPLSSTLEFDAVVINNEEPIDNARVSIVTYQDGVEVDRYPIMQAVTINQGETPIEARYSLPGGFTNGTYTFEVTIEIGDGDTQTVLLTQPIDYEVVVGD